MREWHNKNGPARREKVNAYYRTYYAENADRVKARTSAYIRTERGKEARRTSAENQKFYNAKKVAARQIVRMAIVGGILVKQPCERCGAVEVEAHHEDYDKPLEVNWLCLSDHRKLHRERGDGPSSPVRRSKNGKFEAKEATNA